MQFQAGNFDESMQTLGNLIRSRGPVSVDLDVETMDGEVVGAELPSTVPLVWTATATMPGGVKVVGRTDPWIGEFYVAIIHATIALARELGIHVDALTVPASQIEQQQ